MIWVSGPNQAHAQFEDFSMERLAAGDVNLKTSGSLHFTMDKDWKPVKMIAKENVRLVSPDFQLFCETLTFLAESDQATALGNPVRIWQPGMNASCQKLEIYPQEKKSVLTGNPVITREQGPGQEPTTIKGKEITIVQLEDGTMDIRIEAGELGSANGKKGEAKKNGNHSDSSNGKGDDEGAVVEFSLDDGLRGLDGGPDSALKNSSTTRTATEE
ncbi:MAG: hypothetical protein ACLFUS_01095 [Candidatus Sumerlaeia bacterium]